MKDKKFEVIQISMGNHSSRWLVKSPSTATKEGRTWYATTYPNSDKVVVQTFITGRVSRNLRVADAVRAHIKELNSSQH